MNHVTHKCIIPCINDSWPKKEEEKQRTLTAMATRTRQAPVEYVYHLGTQAVWPASAP